MDFVDRLAERGALKFKIAAHVVRYLLPMINEVSD